MDLGAIQFRTQVQLQSILKEILPELFLSFVVANPGLSNILAFCGVRSTSNFFGRVTMMIKFKNGEQ